jgi:hypothetical protein
VEVGLGEEAVSQFLKLDIAGLGRTPTDQTEGRKESPDTHFLIMPRIAGGAPGGPGQSVRETPMER